MLNQTTTFQIRTVTTPAEGEKFLDVPIRVYADDPYWVPPLRSDVAKQFAPTNPFFSTGNYSSLLRYPMLQVNLQWDVLLLLSIND